MMVYAYRLTVWVIAADLLKAPKSLGALPWWTLASSGVTWPGCRVCYKICECYAALEKLRFSSQCDAPPVTLCLHFFAFRPCEDSLTDCHGLGFPCTPQLESETGDVKLRGALDTPDAGR